MIFYDDQMLIRACGYLLYHKIRELFIEEMYRNVLFASLKMRRRGGMRLDVIVIMNYMRLFYILVYGSYGIVML